MTTVTGIWSNGSHHNPLLTLLLLCNTQVRMIEEMLNIMCDPLELWTRERETSAFLVRFLRI